MKCKTCPRCQLVAFEKLKTYKVCHNCNYNTEEGMSSDQPMTRARTRCSAEDKETKAWGRAGFSIVEVKDRSLDPLFTDSDYSVVRQALEQLPEIEREVVFLKFWKRYDVLSIADRLGLRVKTVENCMSRAYAKLRAICIEHP